MCACVCPWPCTRRLLARYLTNHLWEFCQIYNFNAVGDKDELIRILGQRSGSQRDQVWSEKHFERLFRTYLHSVWTYFIVSYHSYSLPVYMTLMTFSRLWVQRPQSQTTFPKNALFQQRFVDWCLIMQIELFTQSNFMMHVTSIGCYVQNLNFCSIL